MVYCKDIQLSSGMKDVVLVFRNDKKEEMQTFPLPKTIVLERNPETGEPVKTKGPFKNGKLKANVILAIIEDAMFRYNASEDEAEKVKIWVDYFDGFKMTGRPTSFISKVQEVKEWADHILNLPEEAINSYLLKRSLVRVFNSWTSGDKCDDTDITL